MASSVNARKLITRFAQDNPSTPSLKFVTHDPEGVDIDQLVGNGLVNYIFRVSSKDQKQSVIIKYGEKTMRMLPDQSISLDRQVLEYNSLQLLHSTHPGSVPEPYCFDRNHNAMAMQDMKGWELLDTQLQRQEIDLDATTYLGEQLAKIHNSTCREIVGDMKWQEMLAKFSQHEVKQNVNEYMCARIFDEKDDLNLIPEVLLERYISCCRHIKNLKLDKKMAALCDVQQCFIHADCHWKAIFVKEGRTVLFDFEFAYLGHPAFNLAYPATAYLFQYLRQKVVHPDSSSAELQKLKMSCEQGTRHLVESYLKTVDTIGNKRTAFLSELAHFTGGILFSLSVFTLLSLFCEATTQEREAMMEAAYQLMIAHEEIKTVEQLISVMFNV